MEKARAEKAEKEQSMERERVMPIIRRRRMGLVEHRCEQKKKQQEWEYKRFVEVDKRVKQHLSVLIDMVCARGM